MKNMLEILVFKYRKTAFILLIGFLSFPILTSIPEVIRNHAACDNWSDDLFSLYVKNGSYVCYDACYFEDPAGPCQIKQFFLGKKPLEGADAQTFTQLENYVATDDDIFWRPKRIGFDKKSIYVYGERLDLTFEDIHKFLSEDRLHNKKEVICSKYESR